MRSEQGDGKREEIEEDKRRIKGRHLELSHREKQELLFTCKHTWKHTTLLTAIVMTI